MQNRMRTLITQLNAASAAYYGTGKELMPNQEWDAKLEELKALEKETGLLLSGSPTQTVGALPVSKLPKQAHEVPALSLDKTKEPSVLADFLGDQAGVLSWKLDGLTVVLTYENNKLQTAVTRGNGLIGEVITENVKQFTNVPLTLGVPGCPKLIVRGEALISYDTFAKVNASLPEGEEPYKNPRNLCSGSVRQLDPAETKRRQVEFHAFGVTFPGQNPFSTRVQELAFLEACGFTVVGHTRVTKQVLPAVITEWEQKISDNPFPSDGLVLQINDIAYGTSLGQTSKFPKDAMAFKWEDEEKETTLTRLEWSASRSGLINPVAVFEPVELEGTSVMRASVHNVSMVKKLSLSPGDRILVYKANMIIPQISENRTKRQAPEIPDTCPVCGAPTEIRKANDSESLWCSNSDCPAKHLGQFVHAVGRDALNIEGLSEKTLELLIGAGFLHDLVDLFHLNENAQAICSLEGMGERSVERLLTAIEQARTLPLHRLLYALGIPNVGRTASKAICKAFGCDSERLRFVTEGELQQIPDIGDVIAKSFVSWFMVSKQVQLWENLLREVTLETPQTSSHTPFAGSTFVITGSLNHFKNRDECKAKIESLGGKVSGSVSSKTTYLVNNDWTSTSGKNKKAKELNIPIITEETLLSFMEK